MCWLSANGENQDKVRKCTASRSSFCEGFSNTKRLDYASIIEKAERCLLQETLR